MKDCGQFKKLYDKGAYVCVCERERGRERDCIKCPIPIWMRRYQHSQQPQRLG